ncbi:hypothetical protein Syun_024663 [Stephania yunnanensis]|uniref:Avr9/Cf-9 rapidly elicited protein n=1 Tax=Stephania yunnanensis TaxID=152371 RepID=A0AAP0NHN0_9MAGN
MEVHSRVNSVVAKKLWNFLRIAYLMMRKGLISKRKLIIMDINLMMKSGKLLRKTVTNLIFHHHHHHGRNSRTTRGGLQEYEFSCSNSPNPVFFHMSSSSSKRSKHHHSYFPCINPPLSSEIDHQHHKSSAVVNVNLLPKIDYSPEYQFNFRRFGGTRTPKVMGIGAGEKVEVSPLLSPFSVRISNYSSEDDENNEIVGNSQIDDDAEEFITRFYEQLRMQSRTHLLEYQE